MDFDQLAKNIQDAIAAHNWQLLTVSGLIALVYGIRKFSGKLGKVGEFFNSDKGGSVLVVIVGVLMSLLTSLKTGVKLSYQSVINGVVAGALSSGVRNIAWDWIKPADGKFMRKKKTASNEPPASSAPPATPSATPPTVPPAAILLVLVFLGIGGCATSGGAALGACELGKLPQTIQSAIACAISAAGSAQSGDAQPALDACVGGLGGEQAGCLMGAVLNWFKGTIPAHGQARPETLVAIERIQTWKSRHK